MRSLKINSTTQSYLQGDHMLGQQLNQSAWKRGQKLLISKKNDVLRGEDEDDEQRGVEKRKKGHNKQKIIQQFLQTMQESATH